MTFADNYLLRDPSVNFDAVADAIDGTYAKGLTPYGQTIQTSTINITSTSLVAIASLTVVLTIETGQVVDLSYLLNCSNSGASNVITCEVYRDGVSVSGSTGSEIASTAGTGGDYNAIAKSLIDTPAAGVRTYQLYWKTSGGTAYSARRILTARVLRNS